MIPEQVYWIVGLFCLLEIVGFLFGLGFVPEVDCTGAILPLKLRVKRWVFLGLLIETAIYLIATHL